MRDQISESEQWSHSRRRSSLAGVVGNGRTCALVDARGRIGWWCLPTFANFPLFAGLLDPVHGGRLELGMRTVAGILWAGDYGDFGQRYLPGTNILETTWILSSYRVSIKDAMPWAGDALIREVQIATGERSFKLLLRMRPMSPTPAHTRFRVDGDGIAIEEMRCRARGRLVCESTSPVQVLTGMPGSDLVLEFAPVEGRVSIVLTYRHEGDTRQSYLVSTQAPLDVCARSDADWLARAVRLDLPDPELDRAFERSLLALHLLTYGTTGAILAAPTAAFPSEPGGRHNWDYRFCWVRDGSFTARALDWAGCHAEAEGLYRFLLEREVGGQWSSPLWPIEPGYPVAEEQLPGLLGPAGEAPLYIGNAAAQQHQHDSPGNVLAGIYEHCLLTGQAGLAAEYWPRLTRMAEWCCDHWAEPEAGIWEKRDRDRAWVYGRALCAVALRDALRLARQFDLPFSPRWETTQAEILASLLETGWSEEKGAFLRVCGEPSVYDISVLALLLESLVSPEDTRMRSTVQALEAHLLDRSGLRRDEEDARAPFYLATLWMVRAQQRVGEYERALALLQSVVNGSTDLDLMAEYFDPRTSRQYGNIPQAFSHEELVRAVIGMLWQVEQDRLVLFPAIPGAWLSTGSRLGVSNVPVAGRRVSIAMTARADRLDIETSGAHGIQVLVSRRLRASGKRVRLDGTWQS